MSHSPISPSFPRRALWPAAAGMVLGAAALRLGGPAWFGALFLLCAGAAIWARRAGPRAARQANDRADPAIPALARAMFEQWPAPMMLLDGEGKVTFANRAMREMTGADAQGKHVSAVLRTPSVLEAAARATRTGATEMVEFVLPVPIERHYEAHAARIRDAPPATVLLLHDLTAIRRSERMRADFVANASHELRTPLAAVSGFIDTLRGHARDDEAAREKFLGIMSVEAARMRRLIEDLLSLTRIELNEHVPPEGEISLPAIVREAVAALGPLAAADGIAVEVSCAGDLPTVTGERDDLVALFQNLIHNAIKYGRENGHVWISLGRNETGVWVSVRDDGEGIPQTALPRLTERFYRVDIKRSREKGGTGLGLAIVKHIVSRHQGRLQIESRPGEGSNFTVFLPLRTDARVTELL